MDKNERLSDALSVAIQESKDADREWTSAMVNEAQGDPDHLGGVQARRHVDRLWHDREVARERLQALGSATRAGSARGLAARLRTAWRGRRDR